MTYQTVFQRREIKYLLGTEQYAALTKCLAAYMEPDRYGRTSIHSLYYDTPDYRLIRASLEKPVYKEKLRLRSYGRSAAESMAFVELKKKYRGVVYKRRAAMPFMDAYAYLDGRYRPANEEQIHREIDWFLQFYPLQPVVTLSCDRVALTGRADGRLRITFDSNLRWQDRSPRLESQSPGTLLLPQDTVLMEVKVSDALPLWLCRLFDGLAVYPCSYSKYGAYYKTQVLAKNGVVICA